MRDLDIGEVAKRAGIPASTLRFYEEKGLVASVGRRGLRRQYDRDVLERIARMFAPDGRLHVDRPMLMNKADELDLTIRKLGAMRDGLRHAAACRAPSHMECPTFRRLLKVAAETTARRKKPRG